MKDASRSRRPLPRESGHEVVCCSSLQQVAIGSGGEHGLDQCGLTGAGEHQDRRVQETPGSPLITSAYLASGNSRAVRMTSGSAEAAGAANARCLGDDFEIGLLLDERAEAFTHNGVILDEHHGDESTRRTSTRATAGRERRERVLRATTSQSWVSK